MLLLVIINSLIFIFISAIHVYWVMGGQWALAAVIPSQPSGKPMFRPGAGATIVVALGLLTFALLTLSNLGTFDAWVSPQIITIGNWFITSVFLLRAIGDFKYVGFSKKITGTLFAQSDTKIYSPLCATIGLISLTINLLPH